MSWTDYCRKNALNEYKKQQLLKLRQRKQLCGLNLNTLR
jgi:hypothetical protein